jgi:hypothetical protein
MWYEVYLVCPPPNGMWYEVYLVCPPRNGMWYEVYLVCPPPKVCDMKCIWFALHLTVCDMKCIWFASIFPASACLSDDQRRERGEQTDAVSSTAERRDISEHD